MSRAILVAEDDPDARCLVASALRGHGYLVVEAQDGAEMLDRIESTMRNARGGFGAIVSDIYMPRLTGLDVLAALRCARWDTPVILMTASLDDEVREEASLLGASAILDKPLDLAALDLALGAALGGTRA